jgi:diguanylate cyclase (GGDEF)-like protein/PAS domain S-box-containing protein
VNVAVPTPVARLPGLVDEILEALPVAVIVVDDHQRIRQVNQAAELLLGYRRAELPGQPVEVLVPEAFRAEHRVRHRDYLAAPVARRMGANRELLARRADGGLLPVEVALQPIRTSDGLFVIAVVLDISARKALEARNRADRTELERQVRIRTAELESGLREQLETLRHLEAARNELERLTREDPLTGLANRREFAARLAVEYERSVRHEHPLSVAMLDLDRFKAVNDRHGHAVGDDVLRRIGAIVRGQCRTADVPARYGGEEFVIALPDTGLLEARTLCERIRRGIEAHDWDALAPGLRVTASFGIAMRSPEESADEVVAAADHQLYEAKRAGRNRVCVRSQAE